LEKLKKNKSLAESILEQMWILKFGIDRGLDNIKQQAIEDQAESLNGQGEESFRKGDYNDAVKNLK